MRLIDADALKDLMMTEQMPKALLPLGLIGALVDKIPTVDAEPVRKCKDCRWYDTGRNEVDAWSRCRLLKIDTHDDFFCANGERDDVHRE